MITKAPRILVAEDDANDAAFVQRAFRKAGAAAPLHICVNGEEVIAYLTGKGKFADRTAYPFPELLLTDLKMPRSDGFDLLKWLQNHPQCGAIPCMVLSASAVVEDVRRAYMLGANAFFCKPVNSDKLIDIVKLVHAFWSEALLPELPKSC